MTNYLTNMPKISDKYRENFESARDKVEIFAQKCFDAIDCLLETCCKWRM